jgi:tRNA (mo5U34)-methyltransferase
MPQNIDPLKIVDELPALPCDFLQIGDIITVGKDHHPQLQSVLKKLIPWRKGPYNLFGVLIDSEWKSYLKWDRFKDALPPLNNKKVLDIGCNNGYYMFRLWPYGCTVTGIDPYRRYLAQFMAIQKYAKIPQLNFQLTTLENFAQTNFDLALYLGVIYHSRNPLLQLQIIHNLLKKKGVLILESIGIPGNDSTILFPQDRYAKMRNVWFIPTLTALMNMLKRSNFTHLEVLSTTYQETFEQRNTPWVPPPFESLPDFLADRYTTLEGHPAPQRFIIRAQK